MNEYLKHFQLEGDIVEVKPYGNGHINKTFLVKTTAKAYVFQFVNASVFPDVDMLMNNIRLVSEHIRAKGGRSLEIVPTKEGGLYLRVGEDFIRGYVYIANSVCYEKLPSLEMVTEAARGFGAFHRDLSDIDVSQIGDVIPDFHNTQKRFEHFKSILDQHPERVDSCQEEIAFLLSRTKDYSLLVDALARGDIHPAVTHNDPKINNVAFDEQTGKVSCVLDLDTVMTGTFLYDFGDGLRSLFTGDNEDNPDTSLLRADLDIYKAYLDGYASMMGKTMNAREIELLPDSIRVITEELAMRFLGDYLLGDVYFHIDYPKHNLVRARSQIALAKDLIANEDALRQCTDAIFAAMERNMTQRERMEAGLLYDCDDPEIMAEQLPTLPFVAEYNALKSTQLEERRALLRAMFAEVGEGVYVEAPFFANWGGRHVHFGNHVYANSYLNLVDDGHIYVGDDTMFGPNVTLVTAAHPIEPILRKKRYQYNRDIHIGSNVWIGANVTVLPGVHIGDNSVVGACSLVTKDIPANVVAYGSPCRVVREISKRDHDFYYKDEPIDWENLCHDED